MRRIVIALAGVLLAMAPAAAQTVGPPPPLTAEESAKLQWIGERGKLLFDLDRAAWVATDDLREKVRDLAASGLKGYVVERDAAGFIVTFYGGEPGNLVAHYVAHVAAGKVVSSRLFPAAERIPLTALQLRLAGARSAARELGERPCTNAPFNAAIVPPASPDEPLDLYLTSAQVQRDVYPLGGHYLLRIGVDGHLISTRKFTNACMNMPTPRKGRGAPAALFVTHLLDPTPTEIHVFTSLTTGHPVFVVTMESRRLWAVEGQAIRLVGAVADGPPRNERR